MPAFSLEWRPRLDHSAASLATRRSPTHPRTWTLKAPETLVRGGYGRNHSEPRLRLPLPQRAWLLHECHSFGGVLEPR